jgi:hypothetical protein
MPRKGEPRFEHVGDEDDRYREDIFERRYDNSYRAFGQNVFLTERGKEEDRLGMNPYAGEYDLTDSADPKEIEGARLELQCANERFMPDFVRSVMRSDSIRQAFQKEFPDWMSIDQDMGSALQKLLSQGKIQGALFAEILKFHIRDFEGIRGNFYRTLPKLKSCFRSDIKKALEEGRMPPIPEDRIDRRLEEVDIYFVDPLNYPDDRLGDYSTKTDTATIGFGSEPGTWQEIYDHEMFHALSGKTILHDRENEDFDENDRALKFETQRLGLSFRRQRGLVWLNEAITETLAVDTRGEGNHYVIERNQLKILLDNGMSMDIILRAYFEDYNPDDPDRIPAWKTFVQRLNEIYPGRGMRELFEMSEKVKLENSKNGEA